MALNKLMRIFTFFAFVALIVFGFQNCGSNDCASMGTCTSTTDDSGSAYLASQSANTTGTDTATEVTPTPSPTPTTQYDCDAGSYGISNYAWSYYQQTYGQTGDDPWINSGGTFFINQKNLFTTDKVQYFTFQAARFGDVQQVACNQVIPVVNATVQQAYWTCSGGPVVFECRNGAFKFVSNTCSCKSMPPATATPKPAATPTPYDRGGK